MPQSSHTPSPWLVISDAGHPANARISSPARSHIAKVYAEGMARDLVCEANAKLIASAPVMREALEYIAVHSSQSDLRQMARDALADAE